MTHCGDIVNPKLARKRAQTNISCCNSDRKMKITSERHFDVRYSFIKLYFPNLKILVLCCDTIISKLGQKDSKRILKSGTLVQNFWILKHRCWLWRHYSKTGTIRAELTSEIRFSTSWNCKRFWSLIQLAILQKSYFQGYLFLQNTQAHYNRTQLSNFDKIVERRGTQSQWLTYFI